MTQQLVPDSILKRSYAQHLPAKWIKEFVLPQLACKHKPFKQYFSQQESAICNTYLSILCSEDSPIRANGTLPHHSQAVQINPYQLAFVCTTSPDGGTAICLPPQSQGCPCIAQQQGGGLGRKLELVDSTYHWLWLHVLWASQTYVTPVSMGVKNAWSCRKG